MNHRDRQLATIRHEPTDRISLDTICIETVPEIAEYLGINQSDVYERLGIDGRVNGLGPYSGPRPNVPDWVQKIGVSEWGTIFTGDYGTQHWYPLADITTLSEVENYTWPDPSGYDFVGNAKAAEGFAKQYALRGPYWVPVFCQVCDLFGMEEAMVRMSIDPAIFEAVLNHVFEFTISVCESMMDAYGDDLPILCLGDDFATQRGLMISPEQWRRLLKPLYAKIFDAAKRRGKYVWFHSCGDITSVLPDLIDIGVDVWETVQLHALPMSPEQLKDEYGKHITFFGAINTQRLPFASPDEIRAEVERCIRILGKDGGYICGPDHHIKPDVPAVNAVTLFDTALQYKYR
ncbi:MAG: uroporphyrinogen decarboxylase family protein [Armatimonadota bacterium]